MITLTSKRLRVELAEPGEPPYNGCRFDHAGFITEVVLDNDIRFTGGEPKNLAHPSSGGRGLCCEYAMDYSGAVEQGEYFPKFGVGLLKKGAEPAFVYYKKYPETKFFPVFKQISENQASFTTYGVTDLGYNLTTEKVVTVQDNLITMETTAENHGEKAIDLAEYCHNFLSIDGMSIGPEYTLEFPHLKDFGHELLADSRGNVNSLMGRGHGFTYNKADVSETYLLLDTDGMQEDVPFTWCLSHSGVKAYVEGKDYFVPAKVTLWSVDHLICPEVFHQHLLEPGGIHSWKRQWRFDCYE